MKAGVAPDPIIADLGPLKIDPEKLPEVAAKRKAASLLVDDVGFDN